MKQQTEVDHRLKKIPVGRKDRPSGKRETWEEEERYLFTA